MPKRYLSQADKAEVIRLRVEGRMTIPEIARLMGSNNTTVHELVKPFPLTKEEGAAWRARTATKMRAALQGTGNYIGGHEWSDGDHEKLQKMWTKSGREAIAAEFPGRSWAAIAKRATDYGFKRKRLVYHRFNGKRRRMDKFFLELREIRDARGMSRQEVADKAGIHRVMIAKYELGECLPSWTVFRAWIGALGYDLEPIPINATERSRGKRPWVDQEESALRELSAQGSTPHEISLALKRPVREIEQKLLTFGLLESEKTRNVSGMTRARLG